MARQPNEQNPPPDPVEFYGPLRLKAVLAVLAVKHREPPARRQDEYTYGTELPEGFHLPQSVLDD
ncbi:hypothetical protein [Ensifer sp.]|jgi:hypothetical protein|uniref:hypothetical protein n=1 Tax=Ensifer sp. TaxID=1872086 RepID=UPI002E10CF16|nr:hypothetical protein [Ensifer sp.]